ncbi:glycosyltransferase family 25 protein [Paracoccus sp. M683]|nr:glycosyltransferase family 25 protein [Paracoccus sp. M683]
MTVLPRSGARLAVYLINMDGATDRLAEMQARLDALGLPFQRLPGVNGRALQFPIPEFSEWSYRLLHGRRRTPPEIGCYLSHVNAARAFLDSQADLALILEDDASFDADLLDTLDRAAMQRGFWNILRLSTVNNGAKYPVCDLGNGRSLAIALTREKGAGAYVIDRRAAGWFTTKLLPMRLAWDIAFDLEYMAGLRAAFVAPLVASQRSEHETQIQAGLSIYKLPRWRYLTVLPYRAWLEVNRLIWRGGRLIAARLSGAGRTGQQDDPASGS